MNGRHRRANSIWAPSLRASSSSLVARFRQEGRTDRFRAQRSRQRSGDPLSIIDEQECWASRGAPERRRPASSSPPRSGLAADEIHDGRRHELARSQQAATTGDAWAAKAGPRGGCRGLPVVQAARRVALVLGRGGSPGLRGYRRTASARSNRHGRTHRPPPSPSRLCVPTRCRVPVPAGPDRLETSSGGRRLAGPREPDAGGPRRVALAELQERRRRTVSRSRKTRSTTLAAAAASAHNAEHS